MGRLWFDDALIREHAKHLNPSALSVYITLCCHCDKKGETFIGVRKIAELLNINKETVVNAIKKLELYGLTVRLPQSKGKVYGCQVKSVRIGISEVSGYSVHKEEFKEVLRKEPLNEGTRGTYSPAKEAIAKSLGLR
jgi:hypothetical protein